MRRYLVTVESEGSTPVVATVLVHANRPEEAASIACVRAVRAHGGAFRSTQVRPATRETSLAALDA